jgi:ribosomal protein S21
MINVEVERGPNENNLSLIKRFTRKVQGVGVLSRVRSGRYKERNRSQYVKKKQALKSLDRRKKIEELVKLGKLPDRSSGQR